MVAKPSREGDGTLSSGAWVVVDKFNDDSSELGRPSDRIIDPNRLVELFGGDQTAIDEFLTLAIVEMRGLIHRPRPGYVFGARTQRLGGERGRRRCLCGQQRRGDRGGKR